MRKNYTLLFILFLGIHLELPKLLAEEPTPEINVNVTPSNTTQGESVALKIAVEIQSSDSIQAPSFLADDFEVVGQTSSIDIVTSMINGKFIPKRKNNYTYLLYPKKTGRLLIKNIVISIAGKQFKAKDLEVVVEKGTNKPTSLARHQPPGEDEDLQESDLASEADDPSTYSSSKEKFTLNSDFTVRLHLSKSSSYVGEPIIAEYYLYDFGNLTRVDIKKWPTFNGFWKEDLEIPTRFEFREEYINGRRVRKALLGRFALYPLKPGKIEISKLIVDGNFISNSSQGNRANDPFANFFGVRTLRQATHASQTEYVQVSAIPTQNQPSSFSGAIGKFSISLSSNKNTAKVNEPINLKFSVSGIGNFSSIEAPNLSYPTGLELYESSTNTPANIPRGMSSDIRKTISFDILLIPRSPGNFTIPSYAWSYFDIETKSYKTLNTTPISVVVSGEASINSTENKNIPPINQEAKIDSYKLKPIEEILNKNSLSRKNLFEWLLKIFLAINIIIWGFLFLKKMPTLYKKLSPLLNREKADKSIKLALQKIDKSIQQSTVNYSEIENLIYLVLETTFKRNMKGATIHEIQLLGSELNYSSTIIERITNLLKTCQANSFAPINIQNQEQIYKNIHELKAILKELQIL